MLHSMGVLSDNKGLSRVETVCIVGIACFAAVLAIALGWYMLGLMQQGNDANTLNTAEGVATARTAAACLVPGCPAGDDPSHRSHTQADGATVAYYAKGANTLVADPPDGYNESDRLTIDGKEQQVERGTMIIKATMKDGQVVCIWVVAADCG